MVFSSITFLFYFLPAFLLLYLPLARTVLLRNIVFLLASLFFYAWGEAIFVLVMLASIGGNYLFGLAVARWRRPAVLFAGIAFNLTLLIWFKYAGLLLAQATGLAAWLGVGTRTTLDVHLPVGISFFTFQAMSYLIDVYRREARVARSFIDLALFISMFPQLIAGPIVRFQTIQDQLRDRRVTIDKAYIGAQLFVLGLAQKVLIADTLAVPADTIFALPPDKLSSSLAWLGVACYSLQIYFDFAGYSAMAIGLGLVAGFRFPQNFNYPYISQSVTEFWRRWHITLSRWFRDYLYIPLGGNRRGAAITYRNLLIVFALCGLWHGAAWNFLVWGLWHGGFLMLERVGARRLLAGAWRPFRHLYLLAVVAVGWVFFRAPDLAHAVHYLAQMFGLGDGADTTGTLAMTIWRDRYVLPVLALGVLLSTPIPARLTGYAAVAEARDFDALPPWRRSLPFGLGLVLIAVIIFVMIGQTYSPFIYFRF